MSSVTRSFDVEAAPDVVIAYLKEFEHAEHWDPATRTCERIDSGPIAEGSFWHWVAKQRAVKLFGVASELTYTLDEMTEDRLVFFGENQLARTVDVITVEPEGSGSTVTYHAELEMHGTARLIGPVMKLAFQKRVGETERQMTTVLNGLAASTG